MFKKNHANLYRIASGAKMRIGFNFHTSDKYISGVEYYSLGLLKALCQYEQNNTYVVFANAPALVEKYVGRYENLIINNLCGLNTRLRRIAWEHTVLPVILSREKIDLLHCPHYICPSWSLNIPYVVTIHDTIAIDNPQMCKVANAVYYNIFLRRTINKANGIIVPSRYTANSIRERFKSAMPKIEIIYSGIDTIFRHEPGRLAAKAIKDKYNLPDKYILYVGNIEPKKNLTNLLKTYETLKKKGIKHKLVLAGQRNWKSQKLLDQIKSAHCDDVILTGYIEREDLPLVYAQADVFVFPSLVEGFGFGPLEAMRCGTPTAASNIGILQELGQETFSILNPENVEQMAESIWNLIANEKLRRRQIDNASAEVAKFNWQKCARQTVLFYKRVYGTYHNRKVTIC